MLENSSKNVETAEGNMRLNCHSQENSISIHISKLKFLKNSNKYFVDFSFMFLFKKKKEFSEVWKWNCLCPSYFSWSLKLLTVFKLYAWGTKEMRMNQSIQNQFWNRILVHYQLLLNHYKWEKNLFQVFFFKFHLVSL